METLKIQRRCKIIILRVISQWKLRLVGINSLYSTATILSTSEAGSIFRILMFQSRLLEAEYYGASEPSQSCVNCRKSSLSPSSFSIACCIIFQTELYFQTIISLLSIVDNRYLNASHIYKFNRESNVIPIDLTSRNFPRLAHFQDMVKFYRFSLKNIWTKKYNYLYYIIHMHNLNFNDRFFWIIQFCFI